MATKAKYVVGEVPLAVGTCLAAVCIPEFMNHADIRKLFAEPPLSAGFFHVNDDLSVSCYGESVGLRLKAEPQRDARLIARAMALTDS